MLTFLKGGCCKPSSICEMQYVNATFWEKGEEVKEKSYPYNSDCDSWSNDQNVLCYNCNSCQKGFLRTLQGKWRKLGFFLVVMALVLIVSHFLLFLATMWEHFARIWKSHFLLQFVFNFLCFEVYGSSFNKICFCYLNKSKVVAVRKFRINNCGCKSPLISLSWLASYKVDIHYSFILVTKFSMPFSLKQFFRSTDRQQATCKIEKIVFGHWKLAGPCRIGSSLML